jgi:hypothetical protein
MNTVPESRLADETAMRLSRRQNRDSRYCSLILPGYIDVE